MIATVQLLNKIQHNNDNSKEYQSIPSCQDSSSSCSTSPQEFVELPKSVEPTGRHYCGFPDGPPNGQIHEHLTIQVWG